MQNILNIFSLFSDFRGDKEDKKKEKEVKTVILKSKIAENDVVSKVKQMGRWIEKGHSIRVIIGQAGEKGDPVSLHKNDIYK